VKIRALVVDDEALARKCVRRFLQDSTEVVIIAECGDGESAVAAILAKKPDLVFLDVQMPEMNGFEVVRTVGVDRMPATIFVTAYDRYALRAFDANALDYLLKPFGRERFDRALVRAKKRIAENSNQDEARRILAALEQGQISRGYGERLPIAENGRILFVNTKDIDWIEAEGNYARLHVGSGGHELRETLTNLERKLNSRDFLRIHRSAIVNVHRIKEIRPWFRGYHVVVLENGKELRMSRYQREVAERLGLARRVSHQSTSEDLGHRLTASVSVQRRSNSRVR
jgi:two-component system, LytTR family, response regulator